MRLKFGIVEFDNSGQSKYRALNRNIHAAGERDPSRVFVPFEDQGKALEELFTSCNQPFLLPVNAGPLPTEPIHAGCNCRADCNANKTDPSR